MKNSGQWADPVGAHFARLESYTLARHAEMLVFGIFPKRAS